MKNILFYFLCAGFGFPLGNPSQWRVKKALSGGGPLQDLGIYCVQEFCYTTGMDPIAEKFVIFPFPEGMPLARG